ncbi:MAG: phosphoribosylformylglycinamidine synthase subunit PurL [Candidatus Omnitrophica bacterium CG11_big_fil_rev_8_21_14_0_20_64_10]|nr:MAG: phosphoribosylformylglycinamidine synthase subunit PurL [Candidatus Omnitrophica bacterium CG11_big_fil_rev_8_21_14_0_20_64_10]
MTELSEKPARTGSLFRVAVGHRTGVADPDGRRLLGDILDLGISGIEAVSVARIYYLYGRLSEAEAQQITRELLADPVTQEAQLTQMDLEKPAAAAPSPTGAWVVEVGYRPGVMDPVEASLKQAAADLGVAGLTHVRTAAAFTLRGSADGAAIARISEKLLINGTIQQLVTPESLPGLLFPSETPGVEEETVQLTRASDTVLQRISLDHQLSLNLEEMKAIQAYFRRENREPTLIELETLAQTWSEHCKHKTLRGPILYTEVVEGYEKKRLIPNLLKETIMGVTETLALPWCVSVFKDNAGVVAFDEGTHACFKVETHNHPSALEPFGGASTGLGGVIRDILGTGRGAKPVASTDVFCFAPPATDPAGLPPGALHPRRLIRGVVAGVKDYGNKMGIPTVNGAVLFDERFVGNPLVYCGNVGLIPADKVDKRVEPGMAIVVIGGRTGRDGIHGATFSSIGLDSSSETVSATAVQIGDPITEKKAADALIEARDRQFFSAVTDCGAGGLSSAVGEIGEITGARVDLEKVPLKYRGLTPREIWISESQERMVVAADAEQLPKLLAWMERRGVEAAVIGQFTGTGRLELRFDGKPVGELAMKFLHDGLPQLQRPARWTPPAGSEPALPAVQDLGGMIRRLLGRLDTCSKEWIIRQYDHEVQGGSVVKPIVGAGAGGPADAAVIRPRLSSERGLVLANGINFRYGDIDPFWMAALAVDEAVRQVTAVGGRPDRIALLDNFCWGDTTRPQVLGTLVRAALGAAEAARAYRAPFISGKDSLHNEFRVGERVIQIPGTLLISAMGQMERVDRAVTMDLKSPGNGLYAVGWTRPEWGGSSWWAEENLTGLSVPRVDFSEGPKIVRALAGALADGLAAACHDCSEGGIGVAAAEMAFAGGLGLALELKKVPMPAPIRQEAGILFSESATRFLVEVPAEKAAAFERAMAGLPAARIGEVTAEPFLKIVGLAGREAARVGLNELRAAWEGPFKEW